MNIRYSVTGIAITVLIILSTLAIVGHCSAPVSEMKTTSEIGVEGVTYVDREKHWSPPPSARTPEPIAPLTPIAPSPPPPTTVTPVIAKATDKSVNSPTEEVPEKTVDNEIITPPKPASLPKTQRNICYPGWKQTFYLHGVQRWRCRY
jgi:hypothetical protein